MMYNGATGNKIKKVQRERKEVQRRREKKTTRRRSVYCPIMYIRLNKTKIYENEATRIK